MLFSAMVISCPQAHENGSAKSNKIQYLQTINVNFKVSKSTGKIKNCLLSTQRRLPFPYKKKQVFVKTLSYGLLCCPNNKKMNHLLKANFDTPLDTVPFSQINDEDFLPALRESIKDARKNLHTIKTNPEPPDFKNTILALEK